ncbi:MAG: hydantoinase/oxoprolinase family protein, partial [Alphaproteobacteria bacterium]
MRMADEVRIFGAKRGVDPQEFTLLPFGGAGAVHAAPVAEELGMTRILVPPQPGAFSALGLLCTDVVHDYIRSELRPLDQVPPDHAEEIFRELEERGRQELESEGMDPASATFARELDMRYTGQGYELRVGLDGIGSAAGLDDAALMEARERFDGIHARIHGHAAREKPAEVVSYRVRARVAVPKYEPVIEQNVTAAPAPEAARKGSREVWFTSAAAIDTAIWDRNALPVGATLTGPAIVEQLDSTIVVPDGWHAHVDGYRNLILTREL